jgi:alpha-L-fucosidase
MGTKHGKHWIPAECDVSIRPGWFFHPAEDSRVKTPAQLFDLYCRSVGHGASFLLNIPPNREGRFSEPDVQSLKGFGEIMRETFRNNLAAHATVTGSNARGGFPAKNLLSTNSHHCWATDDGVSTPSAELDLGGDKTFDLIRLREPIELGQRVEGFAVDAWQNGAWSEIATATTVGNCRLIRLSSPVTASKVRLRVTQSPAPVLLYDFGLFLQAPGAKQ